MSHRQIIPVDLCPKPSPPRRSKNFFIRLVKRLALIEATQSAHYKNHAKIDRILDGHEPRLRSGLTFTSILTGSDGMLALIALIKSFFSP